MHIRRVCSTALTRAVVGAGLLLMALSPAGLQAQQQQKEEFPRINLTAGRSTVLSTDFDIQRIAVTDPAIADATPVQTREVLIDGKAAGTVSLIIWGANARRQYLGVVDDDDVALAHILRKISGQPVLDMIAVIDQQPRRIAGRERL